MNVANLILKNIQFDGSHYLVVSSKSPYDLGIPDDNYKIRIFWDGQMSIIQIILEENNSIAKIFIPIRRHLDRKHESYETLWSDITNNISVYTSIAVKALNQLLGIYRFFTGEYHIKPITTQEDFNLFLLYNELPPDAGRSKFASYYKPYWSTDSFFHLDTDIPKLIVEKMKYELSIGSQIQFSEELILNAYDYLAQGNPRMAIIEAETGFEVSVFSFVKESYVSHPEKWQKLDNINSFKVFLDHKYTVQLLSTPQINFIKGGPLYDEWNKYVWKVRGNLVHGRVETVKVETAISAIDCIERALEKIRGRKKTKIRRFVKSTFVPFRQS